MFKKKQKNDLIVEDDIIVATSDNIIPEKNKIETKIVQEINIVKEEINNKTEDFIIADFTFYNSDPEDGCIVDEEVTKKQTKNKKQLSTYFEESKKDNKKIKVKKIKETKKSKKQKIKEKNFSNLKNQKVFVFRKKKYVKVEDFIKYLDAHYLEIDNISQEVLDNENFYGWLSKKSGVFDDSIKQFKEIKDKIEKK